MTALDRFEPRGEPMHPYDLLEVDGTVEEVERSPAPVDEADYFRNLAKTGCNVRVNGRAVFLTTTVGWKTKRFRKAGKGGL